MAAPPLRERRIARDGKPYKFTEFVEWYGEHPEALMRRWASAPTVWPVEFDEHAVAMQLIHAFDSMSLGHALEGCWCTGEGQAARTAFEVLRLRPGLAAGLKETVLHHIMTDGLCLEPGRASAFRSRLRSGLWDLEAALRLDPGLAGAFPRCLRSVLHLDAGQASAFRDWLLDGKLLPESVGLEVLRLDPGLAKDLRRWLLKGRELPQSVALEALRLDPSLSSTFRQCLRAGKELPERVALEVLRIDPSLASAFRGWLLEGGGLRESMDPLKLIHLFQHPQSTGWMLPERLAREVLRLDPSLARALWSRGGAGLSEGVALQALRLDPGLAGYFAAWSPCSERVALEALRLDPGCASWKATSYIGPSGWCRFPLELVLREGCSSRLARAVFDAHPAAVHDAGTLRAVIQLAAAPVLVDALRLCRPSCEALGHLLDRFSRDRSGMWRAMEAGITITPAGATLDPESGGLAWPTMAAIPPMLGTEIARLMQQQERHRRAWAEARGRTFAAWCHGAAVRRGFLCRGLWQVLPRPAAYTVAALLCGEADCECRACRRRAQAIA